MKNLLQQYKPFLLFLGKFFLTYLILTIIYQSYLNQFDESKNEVDSFSQMVAGQTKSILTLFDSGAHIEPHESEPSIKVIYKGRYICRIIEGCNALSVIILFISFIVAFTGRFKDTLLFVLAGSVLIHILNLIRIVLLSVALYYLPEYEHILHGVIFPLVIYGVVFLLWVIWVNKFSLHARNNKKQ